MPWSEPIGGGGGGRVPEPIREQPFATFSDLDTFSQSNPTLLIKTDEQSTLAVVNADPDASKNGTYEWAGQNQVYSANGWIDYSGLDANDIATLYESVPGVNRYQNEDVSAVNSVKSLSENRIPMASTQGLSDGPMRNDTNRVLVDKELQIPSGSLLLDELLTVSEDTGFVGLTNNVTGDRFSVIDSRHDRANGSYRPNNFFLSAQREDPVVLQPDSGVQITSSDFTFNYTTQLLGQTNILEFKTYAALTNVRLRIRDVVSGVAFKHIPSLAAWDSGTGGLDFPTIGDNSYDLTNSSIRLAPGRQLEFDIRADQAGFLGANATTPYLAIRFQDAEFRGLAWVSELANLLNGVSRNDSTATFTDFSGNSTNLTMSDITRSIEDLGQGATGGNFSLDNISNTWLQFHPDAGNVNSIIIPSTTDINNDSPWVFDFSLVDSDIPITVQKPNTEFRGGSTTLTLLRNHVLLMWSHVRLPSSPISPTNPLVIYHIQMPAEGTLTQNFNNTVIVGAQGDDSLNGSNFHAVVQTMSRALTLAGTYPSAQHKLIYSIGENNFGNFVNDNATGNVTNLNIDAPLSVFGTVDLADHATSIVCRVMTGGATIGDQCKINVNGTVGNANPSVIQFNGEVHNASEFKCQRLQSTVSIDFSLLQSGSHVVVEVDRFDGTLTQIYNMLDAIPTGVMVVGWIDEVKLPLPLIENGVPRFDSLSVGVDEDPEDDTDESLTIKTQWGANRSLTMTINGTSISGFATAASNLTGGSVHNINYTISESEWSTIYSSSPTELDYSINNGTAVVYSNKARA